MPRTRNNQTTIADFDRAAAALGRLQLDVAAAVAQTLTLQFPGAAYLVLNHVEDPEGAEALFLHSVLDVDGAPLWDFRHSTLPSLPEGPDRARLLEFWGAEAPEDAWSLLQTLRELVRFGGRLDFLPYDLPDDDAPCDLPCFLLSETARPLDADAGDRALRPFSSALDMPARQKARRTVAGAVRAITHSLTMRRRNARQSAT